MECSGKAGRKGHPTPATRFTESQVNGRLVRIPPRAGTYLLLVVVPHHGGVARRTGHAVGDQGSGGHGREGRVAPAVHDQKGCSLCGVQEDRNRLALDHGDSKAVVGQNLPRDGYLQQGIGEPVLAVPEQRARVRAVSLPPHATTGRAPMASF